MTDNAYKPAGYCPHCGYAIDPGVCPECGKNVAADELDSAPYWVTRRRTVKRAVIALVVLSLAVSGWYVYARCNWWIAWVPTRVLLVFQGDRNSRSAVELDRRFAVGQLSRSETASYIVNTLTRNSWLTVRSPHPCDADVVVSTGLNGPLWAWASWYRDMRWDMKVDGELVEPGPGSGGVSGMGGLSIVNVLPGLSLGRHRLELMVTIVPDLSKLPPVATIPQEIIFTLRGQVTVDTSKVVDHVGLRWSPELAEQVRSSATAVSWRRSAGNGVVENGVYLRLFASTVPLAATIEVRPHGQGPYARIPKLGIAVWRSPGSPGPTMPSVEVPAGADRVDIRLVPDARQAFDWNLTEYLNAVVEWHGVPVLKPGAASQPTASLSKDGGNWEVITRPTLVYQATTTMPSQ